MSAFRLLSWTHCPESRDYSVTGNLVLSVAGRGPGGRASREVVSGGRPRCSHHTHTGSVVSILTFEMRSFAIEFITVDGEDLARLACGVRVVPLLVL